MIFDLFTNQPQQHIRCKSVQDDTPHTMLTLSPQGFPHLEERPNTTFHKGTEGLVTNIRAYTQPESTALTFQMNVVQCKCKNSLVYTLWSATTCIATVIGITYYPKHHKEKYKPSAQY